MLVLNLFDSNFLGSACSIAGQTPRAMRYTRNQMYWDGITIFTDEWINNPIVDEVKTACKIGWLREPYCLHPETYGRAAENAAKFDTVLTYSQPFLEAVANARFAPYGGSWIPRSQWGLHPKRKLVSMLVGAKTSTEGHQLRQEVAGRFDEPIDFYGIKGQPAGYGAQTKLEVLSQYYFTIVAEACYEHNLFTEILLDCLMVGTIPIFWGLPNLADFFNPAGVIPFQRAGQLEAILPELSPALYRRQRPAVVENLKLAQEYAITEDWLVEHVFEEMLNG